MGAFSCRRREPHPGRTALAGTVRKELAVSLLTVCGVLSTVGISYLLRHVPVFKHAVVAGERHFVFFVIYGLAISLIAAASTVMRKRDTVIVILAATIAWVVFVETRQLLGMLRFMVFVSLATMGVLGGRRGWRGLPGRKVWKRVLAVTLLPAGLCCVAGWCYYGLVAHFGHATAGAAREAAVGAAWGFSLGLAIGLGLALGNEVLTWMNRES